MKGRVQTEAVYDLDNIWTLKGRRNAVLYKAAYPAIYSLYNRIERCEIGGNAVAQPRR
jgi:hypothetical protein